MPYPAPAKHNNSVTMPYRKIKVEVSIDHILHLPGGQRILTWSHRDGSFRFWDLERGMQVGEEWEDKDENVSTITLSPGGKTVASGSEDGTVKLWNVNTGKIIKTWTGHTKKVRSVCWSSDGGRVVSGSWDQTLKVWDAKSGEIIVGPIKTGEDVQTVCYSPDTKMIATATRRGGLKIWDANTSELLKTLNKEFTACLAWTSDGKTLFTDKSNIDTATWTIVDMREDLVDIVSLSPNERMLASASYFNKTAQLWNLDTNQPIGTPLHHEENVIFATFSADGKFLITSCNYNMYTWDVSTIVKEVGLPSDIVDVAPRPAPKMKGTRRIPKGFFDDALREANLRIGLSQSQGPHNHPAPAPRQRTLGRFSSFWRRSKPHGATERNTQSRSRPFSWTRNLASGILRRQDGSDIQSSEVEVPYTAGQPRNYHARKKKPAASSSRPTNTHTTQQPSGAAQSTPPSSQQPPSTTAASTLSAVTGVAGTLSHPHITGAGWRAHFVGWLCCMPIHNTNGQH